MYAPVAANRVPDGSGSREILPHAGIEPSDPQPAVIRLRFTGRRSVTRPFRHDVPNGVLAAITDIHQQPYNVTLLLMTYPTNRLMSGSARSTLTRLEELKEQFDRHSDRIKADLLDQLAGVRFRSAKDLERFHELNCFIRAYPDGPMVLERACAILSGFESRSDLKKFSEHLVNTGIAGTRIDCEFYWVTAEWLCRHWPDSLRIRWNEDFPGQSRLDALLKSLVPYAETILLDEEDYSIREWIEHLKGPDETDAAFLVRRFGSLACRDETREMLFEDIGIPMSLLPGPGKPSRTQARYTSSSIAWQKNPRSHKRPVLRTEIRKKPKRVTPLPRSEGRRLVMLARQAMVTRDREVEAFANASTEDVFVVDWERGLQFAGMGARPERRHILESVFIFLILNNGVPVGYVQSCVLFGSAETNFYVFDTFRGADAGWLYARAMATIRHLTGIDCIVLDPYQLGGFGNTEGLKTGVWWFYYKMGFRPRDPYVRDLALREARRVKKNPRYRSPIPVLKELADAEMYFYLERKRSDVLSVLPIENVGLHVTRTLARRFGADREKAIATCVDEASKLLGIESLRALSKAEKLAWERWSPLLLTIPDVHDWPARDRRAAAAVITAKGSRHEVDYLRRLERHSRLRPAITELARTPVEE